jgi:hypothetical protein
MQKAACRILKESDIKLEGQFHFDQASQCAKSPSKEKNSISQVTKVSIVENHPQYAVLEIICSCGAKTHVKCQYNLKSQ